MNGQYIERIEIDGLWNGHKHICWDLQPGVNILMLMVVILPFLGLLYSGLQLIFGFKSPKWHPGLLIFILWLLCIIAAAVLIIIGVLSHEILVI